MSDSPTPARVAADLTRLARGGARWALGAQLASQLTSLLVFGIVCRWIAPADLGVFNTALLIVTLPRMLAQLGVAAATIQKEELDATEQATLFWFNLVLSLLCAAASTLGGWCVGLLSSSDRLPGLTLQLAGTTPLAAVGALHLALLDRHLRVSRSATARWLAQAVAGAVTVWLVTRGASVGALLAQQYLELGFLGLAAWVLEPWRPGWPGPLRMIRESLRLGRHTALVNLVFYIAQNSDKLLLYVLLGGTRVGETAVGMYSLAFNFLMKPVYFVSTPVSGVMLPALSRAAPDQPTYRGLALHFYRLSAVLLFPSGCGLVVVAPEVTRVLAGRQWDEAGWLLAILAPAVLAQGLLNITGSLLTSKGHTRWLLRAALVITLVQLQGYVAGFWLGGMAAPPPLGPVQGVAASYTLVLSLVLLLPYLAASWNQVGLSVVPLLRALLPTLLHALLMAAGVWAVRHGCESQPLWQEIAPLFRLLFLVAVGVVLYLALARRELRELMRA